MLHIISRHSLTFHEFKVLLERDLIAQNHSLISIDTSTCEVKDVVELDTACCVAEAPLGVIHRQDRRARVTGCRIGIDGIGRGVWIRVGDESEVLRVFGDLLDRPGGVGENVLPGASVVDGLRGEVECRSY